MQGPSPSLPQTPSEEAPPEQGHTPLRLGTERQRRGSLGGSRIRGCAPSARRGRRARGSKGYRNLQVRPQGWSRQTARGGAGEPRSSSLDRPTTRLTPRGGGKGLRWSPPRSRPAAASAPRGSPSPPPALTRPQEAQRRPQLRLLLEAARAPDATWPPTRPRCPQGCRHHIPLGAAVSAACRRTGHCLLRGRCGHVGAGPPPSK